MIDPPQLVRLREPDETDARILAFNGGRYQRIESHRLLRLALHEIDYLRRELDRRNTDDQ